MPTITAKEKATPRKMMAIVLRRPGRCSCSATLLHTSFMLDTAKLCNTKYNADSGFDKGIDEWKAWGMPHAGREEVIMNMLSGRAWLALVCAAAGWALPGSVIADSFSIRGALDDVKEYFSAPLRWDTEDWLYFGGTLSAIAASHEYDRRVRSHFAMNPYDGLNGGRDNNSLRDALPAAGLILGTGLYAGFIRDTDGYQETWALLEAGILSTATGELLSYAGGRERPDATTNPNQWRQGGDSFPSVHTSAAFAIGMVFAESGNDEYRWVRRILGYGIAGATGYIRVKNNEHWMSDTVAGAALGIATARFVLNRQGRQSDQNRADLAFQPVIGGWRLSYAVKTR